ncbi:MAG: MEDS domain-containing protein [Saprospiraceae bacterium]|nr:MEDS domain-containing protein [Pyrinomonadaceae bacterium]
MLDINVLEDTASEIFWGELSPSEHLLQIYEDDEIFLDTLEGFVAGGLKAGDGVVVLATESHITGLDMRLSSQGIDINAARLNGDYIVVDAEEALSVFIADGWPNDDQFHELVADLLRRARSDERRVRAFGELVAVLWGRGHIAATVRLEYLWHNLCRERGFSLFCAYPKIGFTDFALKSMQEICDVHSRVIH